MVNEVRTLLLNASRDSLGTDSLGYEYVSAAFQPFADSALLAKCRRLLFGTNPDAAMKHWRAYELLRCVHTSSLRLLATSTDSRITYLPFTAALFAAFAAKATVSPITIAAGQQLYVIGDREVSDDGRLLKTWRLDVVDGANVNVVDAAGNVQAQGYTITSGLSSLISIDGANLAARFTPGTGASWTLRSLARPATDLGGVVASFEASLTSAEEQALFASNPTAVLDAWSTSDQLVERAAALALAIANTTAAARA